MDDDLEAAETGLAGGNSSFHKVCLMLIIGARLRLIGPGEKEFWLIKNASGAFSSAQPSSHL